MSGTSSVSKVTQQHHEIMTSLTALSQEKPRAQITEGKDRSSSWQVDRAGCRLPSNIRPGSVAKNDPGATPGSAQFALSLAALTCSGQQNITNRFVWLLLLFFFFPLFHFLEERLPTARIKIECGLCHRNPVWSRHTHIVLWPWGERADKQKCRVIITLWEVTSRKAPSLPLSPD